MTQELFKRSFRITIGDKEFGSFDVVRPLSFSFSVQRDKTITPNNVNILLYNLNDDTRAELEELSGGFGQGTVSAAATKVPKKPKAGVAYAPQDKGVTVRLEAGYGDTVGQLFFGVLRKVSSWKDGPTWVTQISGGDAEHSITTARISKTFARGTAIASVVKELVATLGIGDGNLNTTLGALQLSGLLSGGSTLQRAMTFHGDSMTALEQVMRSCGFEWSIQDGAFYAGPAGAPTVPGEGPVFTPDTGLLDKPQIDKKGQVVGKALLHADLIPGRVFRVESERVTGNFVCTKTVHKGTSDGDDWTVEFVGSPPEKGSAAAALV